MTAVTAFTQPVLCFRTIQPHPRQCFEGQYGCRVGPCSTATRLPPLQALVCRTCPPTPPTHSCPSQPMGCSASLLRLLLLPTPRGTRIDWVPGHALPAGPISLSDHVCCMHRGKLPHGDILRCSPCQTQRAQCAGVAGAAQIHSACGPAFNDSTVASKSQGLYLASLNAVLPLQLPCTLPRLSGMLAPSQHSPVHCAGCLLGQRSQRPQSTTHTTTTTSCSSSTRSPSHHRRSITRLPSSSSSASPQRLARPRPCCPRRQPGRLRCRWS